MNNSQNESSTEPDSPELNEYSDNSNDTDDSIIYYSEETLCENILDSIP